VRIEMGDPPGRGTDQAQKALRAPRWDVDMVLTHEREGVEGKRNHNRGGGRGANRGEGGNQRTTLKLSNRAEGGGGHPLTLLYLEGGGGGETAVGGGEGGEKDRVGAKR